MKNTNDRLVPMTMDKEKEELDLYMQRVEGVKHYSDLPEMERNPFICLVTDSIDDGWKPVQSEKNIIQARDGDGGLVTLKDQRIFYRPIHTDKSTFTKIYRRHLKEMFQLTHGSLKLFGYIMDNMSFIKDPDMVYIDKKEAMDWCEYGENSKSAIYNSLVELCVKGFICKTDKPWIFYVNPAYAFNGNRVRLLTDYFITDDRLEPPKLNVADTAIKLNDKVNEVINDFE